MAFVSNSELDLSRHPIELPDDVREQEGRGRVQREVHRIPLHEGLVHPRPHRSASIRPSLRLRALRTGENEKYFHRRND